MAKKNEAGRFRARGTTGVTLFLVGRDPLHLRPDESYETTDAAELEALRASGDVREMAADDGKRGKR